MPRSLLLLCYSSNKTIIFLFFLASLLLVSSFYNVDNKIQYYKFSNQQYEVFAQTAVSDKSANDFVTYENSTIGIRLQYPPNFEIIEFGQSVAFHTQTTANEQVFSEQVGIITGNDIFATTAYDVSGSATINDYLEEQFNNFMNAFTNYSLVEEPTDITISSNPAKKAVFTTTLPDGKTQRTMEIWTVDQSSGKLYQIEVNVNEGKYPEFPPVHIQKMIDSLEITPLQTTTTSQPGNITFGENATLSGSNMTDMSMLTNQDQAAVPSFTFVNYQNTTYGIQMQYPSNWEKQERAGDVMFLSPLESGTDTFREGMVIIILSVPPEGISLDNFVNNTVDSLRQATPDLQIINSYQTNLANSIPAHRVEYTWTNLQNNIKMKTMEVYTIIDGKSYIISYGAPSEKYDHYLPTVQSMISSLIL